MATASNREDQLSHNSSQGSLMSTHKVPASDRRECKYSGKRNTIYLALAVAIAIPTLLFVSMGWKFPTQSNSISSQQPTDPESLYRALEQKMTVHGSALLQPSDVESAIQRLEERLVKTPNDADGWRILGWSHFKKQDFEKAAHAYRKATLLDRDNAMLQSLYGEALVAAASGQVTPRALITFKTVLTLDPNNVRARFYSGQAKLQQGDAKSAIRIWNSLLQNAPPKEGWTTDLRTRILEVSRQQGINRQLPSPTQIISARKSGPTKKDIENAGRLTSQDQQTMAQEMVARLAKRLDTSPNDPDGWIMLIRSRMVLNDPDAARNDLKRALEIFAKKTDIVECINLTAKALNLSLIE